MKLKEENDGQQSLQGESVLEQTARSVEDLFEILNSSTVSFWVDSSGGPENLCNKSFCGRDPKYFFYGSVNELTLEDCDSGAISYVNENVFDFIEEKLNEESSNKDGVFVGYFSYDLFSERQAVNSGQCPDFFFAYFDNVVHIQSLDFYPRITKLYDCKDIKLKSNMTDKEYLEKVQQIKEEIKKGNVYQVNLTREYSLQASDIRFFTSDLDLYLNLRKESPNPYGCYFKMPFLSILSSSPEEFFSITSCEKTDDRWIRTRPIKGTLPLDVSEIDDKNKAENIMITDLARNDLGRICEYGSIKADRLLEVEKYKHLKHVVSTVEGKLKNDITLREIFEAVFPGGSITGAPKIAAMKIIDDIEPTKRGAYTGSFGFIKTNGEMNFNILIRTLFITYDMQHTTNDSQSEIKSRKSKVESQKSIKFNVGGGIVADSNPIEELNEINLKAQGVLKALGIPDLKS